MYAGGSRQRSFELQSHAGDRPWRNFALFQGYFRVKWCKPSISDHWKYDFSPSHLTNKEIIDGWRKTLETNFSNFPNSGHFHRLFTMLFQCLYAKNTPQNFLYFPLHLTAFFVFPFCHFTVKRFAPFLTEFTPI